MNEKRSDIKRSDLKQMRRTSFESALTLGASLTLPDGPFGRENEPDSAPCEIARLSWERAALFISILYLVSANCEKESDADMDESRGHEPS